MTYDDTYAFTETDLHDLPPVWQVWVARLLMWLRLCGPDGLSRLGQTTDRDHLFSDIDWADETLFDREIMSPEEEAFWELFPPRRLNAREMGLTTATYGFEDLEDLIARMIHAGRKMLDTLKAGHASVLKKRSGRSRLSFLECHNPVSDQLCVQPCELDIFRKVTPDAPRAQAYVIPP